MSKSSDSMTNRNRKLNKLIYNSAIESIGKSTTKVRLTPKPSPQILLMRKEKKELKKCFEKEGDYQKKGKCLDAYISKQKEMQVVIEHDEKEKMKIR